MIVAVADRLRPLLGTYRGEVAAMLLGGRATAIYCAHVLFPSESCFLNTEIRGTFPSFAPTRRCPGLSRRICVRTLQICASFPDTPPQTLPSSPPEILERLWQLVSPNTYQRLDC